MEKVESIKSQYSRNKTFGEEVKKCLNEFGLTDERDQEDALERIKTNDPTYQMMIGKKTRKEFS